MGSRRPLGPAIRDLQHALVGEIPESFNRVRVAGLPASRNHTPDRTSLPGGHAGEQDRGAVGVSGAMGPREQSKKDSRHALGG